MFKFIHAADAHIDSPLRGLEAYEGAPVEQLRGATREAFANLVTLALDQSVDFLIVAGDLFDGEWQDMRTGLWTAGQFRRLAKQGIQVYLIRGNHDAASKVRQAITWPDNVHQFSVGEPETFRIEPLAVALHGQGFATPQCPHDLAAKYPAAVTGCFNIGVLHTSLTGNVDHCTYAPTSEEVLTGQGYDYWALGHIHQRSAPPIREEPYIAYAGNTQGRHIKETGAKGCLLVTVDHGEIQSVDFHATDTVRWHLAEVDLDESMGLSELYQAASAKLAACRDESEGRLAAVRLVLRGACGAHQSLVRRTDREEVLAQIHNLANECDGVWVEQIVVDTSLPIDIDQLRQSSDLMGDLLRTIEELDHDDAGLLAMADEFAPLVKKAAVELKDAGIEIEDPDQLHAWLRQAEGLLVAQLRESKV